ncbi:hypothetical protein LTR70_007077 [Exophiala xenobiotica]|uniref:Uncharacterized protein n=1 Tax=Lithohypha guttulata TaxID=1690604 RepID=A0ABR0K6V7_9EURO|nr:hypothetical protein LTR24_006288 [Lithohypha guttulata]KAK5314640.1 hypothetical protein LTR70_007077 [Exophiala xenobiotica]
MPSAESANDVPLQYSWDVPVTEQEPGVVRIPSPLLYHRRSAGASTEPFAEPHLVCKQTEPVFDKNSFTQTRLMSQIRAACQEEQSAEPTPSAFVAARLPNMGEALSADQSEVGGVGLQDNRSTAMGGDKSATATSYSPPVLTTTNTYIFPRKLYHVVCQPNPAWSGPAYSNVDLSWAQNLVYPKLTIPGQERQHHSSESSNESSSHEMILRSAQPIKCANLATSMPVSIPGLQETRNRSSTQDSFDSKFNVATAIRKLNIPALANSMSAGTKVECWETMFPVNPTVVVASGALNEKDLPVCDTNTAADDEFPVGAQPIESMVDWLFDELDSHCLVHTQQGNSQEDAIAVKNEDLLAYINASEAEEKANKMWFDYHASLGDLEIEAGSDIEEVDHADAEADGGEWEWDNDGWESDELTPATECDEQLGLFATGWEH